MMKGNVNNRIPRLLQLYLLGEITPEEQKELEFWCKQKESNRYFFEQIQKENLLAQEHFLYKRIDKYKAFSIFKQRFAPYGKKRKINIRLWKYVAIFLLPLTIAIIWLLTNPKQKIDSSLCQQVQLHPGSPQALLILDDGKQVALASGNKNDIQINEDIKVSHKNDELVYTTKPQQKPQQEISFNELIIPRGGEYKVTLSDGTLVFLNSATQLKYPITFDNKERRVKLGGEAYFEVTKDTSRPFIVEVDGIEIKVYGTSFNINTQQEGKIQTVLVEGSVGIKIQSSGREQIIVPGEMAEFNEIQKNLIIKKVNTQIYTDWRNGIFRFENERLEDILQKLANWYDVEIFYQTANVKDLHFTGYVERYKKIDTILQSITLATDVQFAIQGKTIIVSK